MVGRGALWIRVFPLLLAGGLLVPPSTVAAGGAENGWIDLPPLPVARQEVGVAALDGEVYVIGGILETRVATGLVSRFDTVTGKWESVPPLPDETRLHHVGAAAAAGRIYCIGGLDNSFRGVETVYAFSPDTGLWEQAASLNRGRGAMGVAVVEDRIYAAGGQNGGTSFTDLEVYFPDEDRWESLPPMPTARNHLAAVAVDGLIYAVGGRSGLLRSQLEGYDPGRRQWTTLAPMPTARGGIAAAALAGSIFVFGGEGNAADPGGIFPQVEAYDPKTNKWESLPDMAHPRHGIGAGVVGDRIHIPGGSPVQGFSTTDVHDAFVPAAIEGVDAMIPSDCNGDGKIDISDGVCLLLHLFATPAILPCGSGTLEDRGNLLLLDANGDGSIDISDGVYLFGFLFLGGTPHVLGDECVRISGCPGLCSPGEG